MSAPQEFAAERREAADQVLLYLRGAVKQPFQGTFMVPNMPPILAGQEDTDYLGRCYRDAIAAACLHFGGLVDELCFLPRPADGVFGFPTGPVMERPEVPAIRFDTVQIVATITEDIEALTTPATVLESVAEVVRMLLCGAIIEAAGDEQKPVQVWLRTLRFDLFPDFSENRVYVAGRLRAAVTSEDDLSQNFLLGGGGNLDHKLPDAAMFAGASRLRFLDLRSPGLNVNEGLLRVGAA